MLPFSFSDLPSVDLLPPKIISDLRDVAAYYYDTPGENHSGNFKSSNNNIILIILLSHFRHNEYVLPDSFQPARQSTQLPQGGQSESVSTRSKCKTQFSTLKHVSTCTFILFDRCQRSQLLVAVSHQVYCICM